MGTVEKAKEMIVDMLTMIGQADVATTQTREISLHPRLNREFVSSLKSLDRKGTKVTRFEVNKLFHERLDDVVSRRSKETGLKRILASARAYNGLSEGWYENSRYTIWGIVHSLIHTISGRDDQEQRSGHTEGVKIEQPLLKGQDCGRI